MPKTDPIALKKIWMDGTLVDWKKANVHILTHALHYGTGLFEGIRAYKTRKGPAVFRLTDHLARLYRGAKAYGFSIPYELEELKRAVFKTIKANKIDHCYIRPLVYLGYKKIGLSMRGAPVHVAIIPVRFDHYFDTNHFLHGISCGVSSWHRLSVTSLSPHVKATANYLNSVLAKSEAEREGYDESIMLTEKGTVSEGSAENIFIVRKGKLITPPFYDGILGGITRECVIELARDAGYVVEEKSILRDELYTADEVFLTGTAAEVIHVHKIDGIKIGGGKRGPITATLQHLFQKSVLGEHPRYIKWAEYVK